MKKFNIKNFSLLIVSILLVGCSGLNKTNDSHMTDQTHMEMNTHMHGEISTVDVFTPVEEFLDLELDNYKDYELYGHRVMMADNSKYITKNTGNIFMNYMIPHHEGAIITAQGVMFVTEDEELKALCEGIISSQVVEVKEMQKLLSSKNLDDNEVKDFEKLMMKLMGNMMGEMIVPEDDLNKEEAEYLFLSNMIAHHKGAVKMAEEYLKAGENSNLLVMNRHIVITQNKEIEIMEKLLKNRQSE